MRSYSLFVVALSLTPLLECGKDPSGVPVSGRLTRDGQPLAQAHVVFQALGSEGKPDPDKEAAGETDDNGQYTLTSAQFLSQVACHRCFFPEEVDRVAKCAC